MLRSVNLSDAASCSAECRGHVDCVLSSGGLDYTVEFFCEESIAENVPLFGNCGSNQGSGDMREGKQMRGNPWKGKHDFIMLHICSCLCL